MDRRLPPELDLPILTALFRSFADEVKPYYLPQEWKNRDEPSLLRHPLLLATGFPWIGVKTSARECLGRVKLVCRDWAEFCRKVEGECRLATGKNTPWNHVESDITPYARCKLLIISELSSPAIVSSLIKFADAFTALTALATTAPLSRPELRADFFEGLPDGLAQLEELAVGGITSSLKMMPRQLVNLRCLEIGVGAGYIPMRVPLDNLPLLDIIDEISSLPKLESLALVKVERYRTRTDPTRLRQVKWQSPLRRLRLVDLPGLTADLTYLILARLSATIVEVDICLCPGDSILRLHEQTMDAVEDRVDFPRLRQLRLSLSLGLWGECIHPFEDDSLPPLVNPLALVIQDAPSLSILTLSSTVYSKHYGIFRHPQQWSFFVDMLRKKKLKELEVHAAGWVTSGSPPRTSGKTPKASTEPKVLHLLKELEKKGVRYSWTDWTECVCQFVHVLPARG